MWMAGINKQTFSAILLESLCSLGRLERLLGLGDDDALEVRVIVVVDQLGIVLSLLTSTHFYTLGSMHTHAYAFEV